METAIASRKDTSVENGREENEAKGDANWVARPNNTYSNVGSNGNLDQGDAQLALMTAVGFCDSEEGLHAGTRPWRQGHRQGRWQGPQAQHRAWAVAFVYKSPDLDEQ